MLNIQPPDNELRVDGDVVYFDQTTGDLLGLVSPERLQVVERTAALALQDRIIEHDEVFGQITDSFGIEQGAAERRAALQQRLISLGPEMDRLRAVSELVGIAAMRDWLDKPDL